MSEDMKEIIEHLNETNRTQDTSDPVSLSWITSIGIFATCAETLCLLSHKDIIIIHLCFL
jgi:hypothetical protein